MSFSHPISVLVLTSGATLEHGVKEFIRQLEHHADIELKAVLCEAETQTQVAVWQDLWHRRKFLAFPLFALHMAGFIWHWVRRPQMAWQHRQLLVDLQGRYVVVPDVHDPKVLARVGKLSPDLGLSYGSPILKPNLFGLPKFGTLGIHHGKVPAFRGKKTMFWAMATGETEAGVTIQRINAGIDTGEIVAEGTVPIHNRLPHQVWRDLEALGLQLYLESILAIKNNIATFTPQAGKKGKLYSDPTWQDLVAFYKKWMFKKIFGTQTSADERG